jgi:hypothetical protein
LDDWKRAESRERRKGYFFPRGLQSMVMLFNVCASLSIGFFFDTALALFGIAYDFDFDSGTYKVIV